MSYTSRFINNPIFVWTLANSIGLGVMGLLTLVIPTPWLMTRLVTNLIIFIPIGLAQWLALRRFISVSPLWIFTILMGILLIPYLPRLIPPGLQIFADDESVPVLTVITFLIGFTIGLPQWLILRRQVREAVLWVPGSAVGLAGGLWFLLVTEIIDIPVLNTMIALLIYCLTTGLLLTRLLTQPRVPQNKVLAAS